MHSVPLYYTVNLVPLSFDSCCTAAWLPGYQWGGEKDDQEDRQGGGGGTGGGGGGGEGGGGGGGAEPPQQQHKPHRGQHGRAI